MKTTLPNTPHDSSSSSSFSKRHFQWRKKTLVGDEAQKDPDEATEELVALPPNSSSSTTTTSTTTTDTKVALPPNSSTSTTTSTTTTDTKVCTTTSTNTTIECVTVSEVKKSRPSAVAVLKLKWALASSALSTIHKTKPGPPGLGPRVTGTLYGHRKGHVQLAFQDGPKSGPAFLIELATPTAGLVREMASGLVRIALECDRPRPTRPNDDDEKPRRLVDEPKWRTYCNGRKRGFASRRDCGPSDWKVFKAVEMVSMGAGVLPGLDGPGSGEVMYMRAGFERVVGSKDSEAYYMINPDLNSGGPELSIYLLRV